MSAADNFLSFFSGPGPFVNRAANAGFGHLAAIFQGRNRPIFRSIVKFLGGQCLASPAVFGTLNFLNVVGTAGKRTGDRQNGPGGFRRKPKIHHGGSGGTHHIQIDRFITQLLSGFDNLLGKLDVFSGHSELFGPRDHAPGSRVFEHQTGNAQSLVIHILLYQQFGSLP